MLRLLQSLRAWRDVWNTGIWLYQENGVTGRRRAIRIGAGGHQPVDRAWLDGAPSR